MKFHRIKGKLPVGATLRIDAHTLLKSEFIDTIARHSSNAPITFTLDVPESAAAETANILREMANELAESPKR